MPGEVTIDFGIDLGTTNSAIAVFHNGAAVVIKSPVTNADVTPSAVTLADGREWVGAAAKNILQTSTDYADFTFFEFKRNIGTVKEWPLPDGTLVTPEELSAKVLRSLIGDAAQHAGADVTAAVVTVPAAFDTSQISATREAGKMAGLSYVETLQEPIAAALAYGFDQAGDGVFLVFDFGGGTFDAALMQSKGGIISVIDHRGDNDLGGGKWDTAIVEQLLAPRLASKGFAVDTARDRNSSLFKLLKDRAETARIELSRERSAVVRLGGINDDGGRPLEEVIISVDEFEALAQPIIRRSLNLTKELLQGVSVSASSISKLVLVGGPTRTPALRRAVDELGIEVAAMVDPMTVVARGAAIYAAARTRPVAVESAPQQAAVFQLEYQAMVEAERDEVDVGIRLERHPSAGVASVRVTEGGGGWDSGEVPLEDEGAIVSVKLFSEGTSSFRLTATSENGQALLVTPESFSIERGGVGSGAAPVNHSIGVGVDETLAGGVQIVLPVVRRGTRMPVFERVTVRTTRAVSPGQSGSSAIRLLFLEGESSVVDRTLTVGEIEIGAEHITRPLPANSDIEIVVRWEEGEDPHASAYIPFLDQHFKEVLTVKNKKPQDLSAVESKLRDFIEQIGGDDAVPEIRSLITEKEVAFADAQHAQDVGDQAEVESKVRLVHELMDKTEEAAAAELTIAATTRMEATVAEVQTIVDRYGSTEEKQVLETLIQEARGAATGGSNRDVDLKSKRIEDHYWRVVMQQPAFWIEAFKEYSERASESSDPVRAGALIEQGRAAIDRGDVDGLIKLVRSLWDLFPDTGASMGFGIRRV